MNKKELNILLIRKLSGEISAKELNKLEMWINDSEENRQYMMKLEKAWSSIKAPQPKDMPDFEEFWQDFSHRLKEDEVKPAKSEYETLIRKKRPFSQFQLKVFRKPAFSYAFAVLLLISIGIFVLLNSLNQNHTIFYSTKYSERKSLILPDGSTAFLNAGSQLSVMDFKDKRIVYLKGQALFNVLKNKGEFWVLTDNADIKVTGTKFDVKAREGKTRVVVEEGTVLLNAKSIGNSSSVAIHADQMSECYKNMNPTSPAFVNAKYINGWVNNSLIFEKNTLKEITNELQRQYNINIKIENSSLQNRPITGQFTNNQPIEDVLNAITLSLNAKYKKENNTFIIYQ
ncbi:MAG: DUF4974 domain-containing protein [Bacteroidota bacterium]|nr:DUF4974 domain-containing protein [Bacteroidota bacterium]